MSRPVVSCSRVLLDLLDELVLVRTIGSSQKIAGMPELRARVTASFDPVADRRVLDLAHAPDIAFLDVLRQQHFASGDIDDVGGPCLGDLECLVVRAVFLGLLGHEADVRDGTHGPGVEVAVPFAEVDHLLVDPGEGRFRHYALAVVLLAVSAPHLAALTDHCRHRASTMMSFGEWKLVMPLAESTIARRGRCSWQACRSRMISSCWDSGRLLIFS